MLSNLFMKIGYLPLNKKNEILLTIENKINLLIIKNKSDSIDSELNYLKLRIDNKYKQINNFL
jgi:S-adenosylmethionine synthetase